MPARDLAMRMGVTESTVVRLEGREVAGKVQLDSLARAAEALDCDLVYALVPRRALDASVREQARAKAEESMANVAHSMGLEDQPVPDDEYAALVVEQEAEWEGRPGLWDRR
jgi:predicted DNA-binding mobile mystery protein A